MPGDDQRPVREQVAHWIEHLTHVLPAQAPISDFVHHNTLHGFQHLPFEQALAAAQALNGATPYWPESRFHSEFAGGRINRDDLLGALQDAALPDLDQVAVAGWLRRDVLLAGLLTPLALPAAARLDWLAQEGAAPALFALPKLALSKQLTVQAGTLAPDWQAIAEMRCVDLFGRIAQDGTVRNLLLHLTGEDVLERVRCILQRHLAAHLDQGLASWLNPLRAAGFYTAWRDSASGDMVWDMDDLPAVRQEIADLPDSALEALLAELARLLPDQSVWPAYLERLALEMPGWSGMFLWRDRHPSAKLGEVPVAMVDYLAVRMVLERLLATDLIERLSGSARSLPALQQHYMTHLAEFYVRDSVQLGCLSEETQHRAAHLLCVAAAEVVSESEWQAMAAEIAGAEAASSAMAAAASADRLADLLSRLDASPADLAMLTAQDAARLLAEAGQLTALQRGHIWLLAYERHYREEIFSALQANQLHPPSQPKITAQVVCCMDDREEGTRRHLEEIAPGVATYGAAGFFGVAMYWQGIDDPARSALCPIVVRPEHLVREVAGNTALGAAVHHARRRELRLRWRERFYQSTRRDAFYGPLLSTLLGLPALLALLAVMLLPAAFGQTLRRWREAFEGRVDTELHLNAAAEAPAASADQPQDGFKLQEQVDRVEDFLRSIGLTEHFAPLVLMLGHGSGSQNNPHLSAYDCGACSGRHGGPNARVFAAMANRTAVRAELVGRGLAIPAHCLFVAAEHNTCDDSVHWYDLESVPPAWQAALDVLLHQVGEACRAHAVERCRRLASAPLGMSPWQAFQHVRGRLHDISQARPELGHANNATAIVGRRAMTQGLFLDRRAFLISYDPVPDTDGQILAKLLLAVGPVGAGISLEYYFSSVDNQRFGCGSKVTHNLTGLFGVMEGADSDLRTGLPWQMVEIHEPMRLLVVVEQTTAMLTRILGAQPALQELINKAWIILAAQDPSTAKIEQYCPRRGWLPWAGKSVLPQVAKSQDWFAGERGALSPAILLGGVAC